MSKTRGQAVNSLKQRQAEQTKRYRRLYAEAKRKGLVKGDKDARSFKPSSYMKTKLNKLEPFMGDEYTVVTVPKKSAKIYREIAKQTKDKSKLSEPVVFGNRVVTKNKPNYVKRVRKGIISNVRPLAQGEFEEIKIPFEAKDIHDLLEKLESNPIYQEILKHEREDFSFVLHGNMSNTTFANLDIMVGYIRDYQSFTDGELDLDGLTLFRSYKDWKKTVESVETMREKYSPPDAKGRSRGRNISRAGWRDKLSERERQMYLIRERERSEKRRAKFTELDREKDRERKRKKLENETPEQREARLAKAREYKKRRRNDK